MNPNAKKSYSKLDTPCLILQEDLLLKNLSLFQQLANANNKKLRPHIKAHKSIELAKIQIEIGAVGICCSKLAEAEIMVEGGIKDILITSPIVGDTKLDRLGNLSQQATISVVTDSKPQIIILSELAKKYQIVINVFIEIDIGQARCGVQPGIIAFEIAQEIIKYPNLSFSGIQAYHGKLQGIKSFKERTNAIDTAMEKLSISLHYFKDGQLPVKTITGGGTGSFLIDLKLPFLNELQPGSYVTMDCNYSQNEWDDAGRLELISQPLSVLSTVISKPQPNKVILDAGWKSISNDAGTPKLKYGSDSFDFAGDEHGVITSSKEWIDLEIGDQVELIPSHCDTTINLYDHFYLVNADYHRKLVIDARGKIT
jgi:D-serine deaminase-like pyridoxal phosphate-dependent protein